MEGIGAEVNDGVFHFLRILGKITKKTSIGTPKAAIN